MLKCPMCGGEVTEKEKSFSCSNWKSIDGGCKFTIWKESFGARFTKEDVEKLINGEVIVKTNISKSGNEYPANWLLDNDNKAVFEYVEK